MANGKAKIFPRHLNGKVGTHAEKVWDQGDEEVYSIFIDNTHGANTLYVSFDGGTHFKAIGSGSNLTIEGWGHLPLWFDNGMKLKGSGADTTYEILILRSTTTVTGVR